MPYFRPFCKMKTPLQRCSAVTGFWLGAGDLHLPATRFHRGPVDAGDGADALVVELIDEGLALLGVLAVPGPVTGNVFPLAIDAGGIVFVGFGHVSLLWLTFCVYISTLYYICQ